MIEAPDELQRTLGGKIPSDHLDACRNQASPEFPKKASIPVEGNAAGNTVDLLDLKGEPSPPAPLPDGFTPRGIVALTFSIVAALLGLAAITWYGLADIGAREPGKGTRGLVARSGSE